MTKLNSALPKGEANGLAAIARELIDQPATVHVVVVLVDCKRVTTDIDTGDIEPTARIRRIEPIKGDKELVSKIMRRAMEERTGKTVLPFDLEEDMRSAFGEGDA
jgi:ribosome maturation protein Sdo1